MKRIELGITIIVILMLVGCNNIVTDRKLDLSDRPTASQFNYVKIYEDEKHKEIKYGKLCFDVGVFHIVSNTRNKNIETFECEIDKGVTRPETHITITIQEIEKQDFPNIKSILSYLSEMSPNYEKIRIYNNITDDSGVISLYSITEGGLTNYVVCYRDACYLVECGYSVLDVYLFKNDPKANYEVYKQRIECANSFTAYINKSISYDDNKVGYNIIQGKNGIRYSAEASLNKENQYNFILRNDNGQNMLTLFTSALDINDVIKFLDVNMDGYVDIQFLDEEGTMNNSFILYVWDDIAKNFIKVKCEERLSEFEVHNGYLINQQKTDANSGVIQKLVWEKDTLIKESEEDYQIPRPNMER